MYRSQAALTAVVSVFVLGSSLSLISLLGVCATVAGAALVAKDHEDKKEGFEALRNEDRPKAMSKGDRKVQKAFDKSWIAMALTAGVLLTVKDITAVLALKGGKMSPSSYVVSQCLFGALIVFAYKLVTEGTLRPKLVGDANPVDLIAGMGLVSLDNFLWCAVLVYLMSVARNPAFPKAVTMSGVALTAFLSSFLFKGASLDRDQWGGIALILGGVAAVILG
jgi:drug/metabolite transporter (DMT)-like permease